LRSLVTGGAGFIGSHLVDALVERGDEVLVVDDFSSGRLANLATAVDTGVSVERLDVTQAAELFEVAAAFRPESVFHLAAQIDVRSSMSDPGFDARVNVIGTVNALESACRGGASSFVFTSSGGAVYGEGAGRGGELPFGESAACEPVSVYGQSKLAAEGYVELYRRTRGLPATSLRLGNVYGPRQDPATEAGVVAIFCRTAANGGRPTVFSDGEQTRDYVHVSDAVGALLAAESADDPGPLNVGTGTETSVLELAERIGAIAGRHDFQPEFAPAREGEVERTALDPAAAERRIGWRAAVGMESGLRDCLT
jgi:UDP-glucose 4-epimerase